MGYVFVTIIGIGLNLNMACRVNDNYTIIRISNKDYWESINPVKFLEQLKSDPHDKLFIVEVGPDSSWFDPNFILEINNYLGDYSEASIVCSAYESNLHTKQMASTMDVQARFLLKSFEIQKYPPTLCSFHNFE